MTWRDKLEIGLKEDAPFRRDNLPESQTHGTEEVPAPTDAIRSPEDPAARHDAEVGAEKTAAVRARLVPHD
jgi:hypothetical protein